MATSVNTTEKTINTWQVTWQLIRLNPWFCAFVFLLFAVEGIFPVALGVIMGWVFDHLAGTTNIAFDFWTLIALLIGTELGRVVIVFNGFFFEFQLGIYLSILLRKNMLARIFELPGAQALIAPPGELISRFSGDQETVRGLVNQALITMMGVSGVIFGLPVMMMIEPRLTVIILVPLVVSIILLNYLRRKIDTYRTVARQAEGAVTNFVGEIFGAVQAIKIAGAEATIADQFRQINQRRQATAVRDSVLLRMLMSLMDSAQDIAIGLILLFSARTMATNTFTLGNFALFIALLPAVSHGLNRITFLLARHKQAVVSLKRLIEVLQGAPPSQLMQPGPTYLSRNPQWPALPHIELQAENRLKNLRVEGLTYCYPDTHRGIVAANFALLRGSLTVITGRIGSGKTTLLRALLGLLPASGKIYWNGRPVTNPAEFFVPPHCAYTPQVPHLVSEPLRDAILQGISEEAVDLQAAIMAAALEPDIAALEKGLDTLIGSRGIKLSGGQLQRTAAARMIVRQPELYVFDDLSSALDVNTEQQIWAHLFAPHSDQARTDEIRNRPTFLVVSHRHSVLQRANHILVLKEGQVIDEGNLADLLLRCEEMRQLWHETDT